ARGFGLRACGSKDGKSGSGEDVGGLHVGSLARIGWVSGAGSLSLACAREFRVERLRENTEKGDTAFLRSKQCRY
ncbi:MAG TPA: hypothetical protein VGI11_09815, partial [Variovorax sp.]